MNASPLSFMPALGLLILLVLLAWGVQWIKKRTHPQGSGIGANLRLISQLSLGPQQRVAVVEVQGPQGTVHLTLGITQQHVRTLHTQVMDVDAMEAVDNRYSQDSSVSQHREPGAAQ